MHISTNIFTNLQAWQMEFFNDAHEGVLAALALLEVARSSRLVVAT